MRYSERGYPSYEAALQASRQDPGELDHFFVQKCIKQKGKALPSGELVGTPEVELVEETWVPVYKQLSSVIGQMPDDLKHLS